MTQVIVGDALTVLRERFSDESVQCVVTSPPYWGLRDYGVNGQLGLEKTPEEYVSNMVEVFRDVRRVVKADGTRWLNLGDSYNGSGGDHKQLPGYNNEAGFQGKLARGVQIKLARCLKPKDLVGIPWRVAFALQADGWYLRSDIIWSKPNPMPESVTDRPTKAHEYLFLLSKSERYYYDQDAIREQQDAASLKRLLSGWNGNKKRDWPGTAHNNFDRYMGKTLEEVMALPGSNKRSVWTVSTQPYPEAHFATFPPKLIEPCILAGCPSGGLVLDPFAGSGTTLMVAQQLGRRAVGIELNPAYVDLAEQRLRQESLNL